MGGPKRTAKGGLIYPAWNRAHARVTLFEKDEDYEASDRIVGEA